MKALLKHRAEFLRALEGFKYDVTEGGIYFPKSRALLNGVFTAIPPDGIEVLGPNTMATETLIDVLKTYFAASTQSTGFWLAPFSGNVTPQATWTGVNFAGNATEVVNYNQSTRQQWVPDTITTALAQNAAAPGTFTITTGPQTVRGCGLIANDSARGGITGRLVAAARFAADITGLPTAADLGVKYAITSADGG